MDSARVQRGQRGTYVSSPLGQEYVQSALRGDHARGVFLVTVQGEEGGCGESDGEEEADGREGP